ncbi:unnamed protein product, partial [Larinioides sclopetarius]
MLCPRPKIFREIPREKAVFNAQCPDMAKSVKCLEEYDMTCTGEEHRRLMEPERYANIISVLSEICEEGSTLNEVAISNLKCFNETFSNTSCKLEREDFIDSSWVVVPFKNSTGYHSFLPERIYCIMNSNMWIILLFLFEFAEGNMFY